MGERIAPVSVDMALTRSCGAMCSFCYAMVQESQERPSIKTETALNLLDDFALRESTRVTHVCNAPSPAATASLAIGEYIATRVGTRLSE